MKIWGLCFIEYMTEASSNAHVQELFPIDESHYLDFETDMILYYCKVDCNGLRVCKNDSFYLCGGRTYLL
jgi:hypothetical protein